MLYLTIIDLLDILHYQLYLYQVIVSSFPEINVHTGMWKVVGLSFPKKLGKIGFQKGL